MNLSTPVLTHLLRGGVACGPLSRGMELEGGCLQMCLGTVNAPRYSGTQFYPQCDAAQGFDDDGLQ